MTEPDAPEPGGPGNQNGTGAATQEPTSSYRWVAMGVVLVGTFMVVLDTTVVNLGLPSMQRDFSTIDGVEWVVTAYLAAVGVAQMTSGWASDRFGRKRAFMAALVFFVIGSVLCAAAPSIQLLVVARVIQGIGGGLLMPVAMATIYELFDPSERGRALGYFGIAVMAAPAIGPVLGGGLVEWGGWRWLFLINIPIGLVGIPLAHRLLRDTGYRQVRAFDSRGLALSGLGLTLLLVGVSMGGLHGWGEPGVVMAVLAGAAVLAFFVHHALRVDEPLVDVRILANPIFAIGMATLGLLSIAQYSRLVYIPLELGSMRGINEFRIGLVMLPSALGIASMMPVGGRLADRVGARIPMSIGVVLLAASFWPLGHLQPDSSLVYISACLFVGGIGSGLCMMAPNIVALNAIPAKDVSQGSGLSSVARQLSAAIGTGILAAVFASIRPPGEPGEVAPADAIGAYNTIFLVSFGLLLVTLVVAQFLPGKEVAHRLQEERRAESLSAGGDPDEVEESSLILGGEL